MNLYTIMLSVFLLISSVSAQVETIDFDFSEFESEMELEDNSSEKSTQSNDETSKISPNNFTYTDQVIHALKVLESYQSKVYYDRNDNLIFGYGHLVLPNELESLKKDFGYEVYNEDGTKSYVPPTSNLSDSEKKKIIEDYLRKDTDIVLAKIKKNVKVSLEQHKIDALVIYLFWRGANEQNLEVKEFYELVNKGEDKAIADFIANRPKKDKTYLSGNIRRNRKNADLYLSGKHPFWD